MVARHEHDAVVAGASERRQRLDLGVVRRQHPIQSGKGLRFGAPKLRGDVAIGLDRLQQLERVAVQDEVDGAATLNVDRVEERRQVRRPSEVFVGVPAASRRAARPHVQVAHHNRRAHTGLRLCNQRVGGLQDSAENADAGNHDGNLPGESEGWRHCRQGLQGLQGATVSWPARSAQSRCRCGSRCACWRRRHATRGRWPSGGAARRDASVRSALRG